MDSMLCLNTSTTFQSSVGSSLSEVKYKSGANFSGHVQNYKKIGSGTFTWPDGSFYVGEYVDNYRHGNGLQQWADGTQYTGCFVQDFRHGEGAIKWSNGETYEGTFFKDRRHGKGKYTWPDNSSYIGSFYIDKKEGYGTFYFADGKRFEGLYKNDEREGPGIFTYEDGHQDVGFWHGECVIKLLTQIENAFTIKYHPEFEYQPQIMSLHIDPTIDRIEHVKDVLQPPEMFDYIPEVKTNHILTKLYVENLDPHSLAVDHQAFDIEFFKDLDFSEKPRSEILLWNKTPSLVNLQIHIFKHRLAATSTSFMVDKILQFDRSSFKECSLLEISSEELINMAAAGNTKRLGQLLNSGTVHPDVSDRHGFTALVAATINWHQDSINILLNAGANINQLTDEGVSALTAGMIFYYPIESFQKNIAEKYMMKTTTAQPQDQSNSQNSSTVTVSQKELKISQPDEINQHKTEVVQLHEEPGSKTKDIKNEESQAIIQKDNVSEVAAIKKKKDDSCNREEVKDSDKDSMLDDQEKDKEIDEEFESNVSVHNFQIDVTDYLVERCATQLSLNERIISQESTTLQIGKARKLAIQMSLHQRMKETLELLLRRGANPNTSDVPMPALFLAIKAADVDMVRTLLLHGASTQISLAEDKGCLAPLHIACAIPGEEGVAITELLLNALADPDVRALEDESFFNQTLEEEWSKDTVSKESKILLGGRTPLHIACARDDNYKNACQVVHLLLEHNANPNLLCNGFSPLALAISSGNDLAIDKLLQYGADPSLTLTHGVGSALCVATSTEYEHRRTIQGRIQLIDQLIKAGANILAPIPVGLKRSIGTAVDFAYYMFNQDRRIAHTPYHALTHSERETYNARRKLLAHIGDILRDKAIEKEMNHLKDEENKGLRSISSSADFVYVGAGASLPLAYTLKAAGKAGQVTFEHKAVDDDKNKKSNNETLYAGDLKKPLFRYCYDCGRSVGIRLSACTRCKEVFYCSKACKLKAWNARHKEECIRVGGRSRSPSPMGNSKRHLDSPAFAHADKANKTQDSASLVYTDKVSKTQRSPALVHVDKIKKTQHSVAAEISKNKNRLKAHIPIEDQSQNIKGATLKTSQDLGSIQANKPFRTEDGRLVYLDNYSYN